MTNIYIYIYIYHLSACPSVCPSWGIRQKLARTTASARRDTNSREGSFRALQAQTDPCSFIVYGCVAFSKINCEHTASSADSADVSNMLAHMLNVKIASLGLTFVHALVSVPPLLLVRYLPALQGVHVVAALAENQPSLHCINKCLVMRQPITHNNMMQPRWLTDTEYYGISACKVRVASFVYKYAWAISYRPFIHTNNIQAPKRERDNLLYFDDVCLPIQAPKRAMHM